MFTLMDVGEKGAIGEEDVETGLRIYSLLIFCNQMKLDIFLNQLITTETKHTVIKTVINTIESGSIKNIVTEKMVSEFYLVMKNMFHLQYEDILLATASLMPATSARALLDLPYFFPYHEELEKCGNGTSCPKISQAINSLGKGRIII